METTFSEFAHAAFRLMAWWPTLAGIAVGLATGALSLREVRRRHRLRHDMDPLDKGPEAR